MLFEFKIKPKDYSYINDIEQKDRAEVFHSIE